MFVQRMMWIAWPAFLVAGLLEVLVFGLVESPTAHREAETAKAHRG